MKKLSFIIATFLILGSSITSCTTNSKEASLYWMLKSSRDSLRYYKAISNQMQRDLHTYEVYRESTERLLDSIGIYEDAPILETKAGQNYLDAVEQLQNTQSSTSYNQTKK